MSKLHKKMVALGDMTQHSYADVVSACGPPRESGPCTFTDIGEGTRATWSDGVFTITFNFDSAGHYCGIYHHRNWGPYIWLGAITVVLVAAALIAGGIMRRNAQSGGDAASLAAVIMDGETRWRTDSTAGASLIDLDFDGTPELLAVDTALGYNEALEADYFSADSTVRVYRLSDKTTDSAGSFDVSGYCFAATLAPVADYDPSGAQVWFCTAPDGQTMALTLGEYPMLTPVPDPAACTPGQAVELMQNESWVSLGENTAAHESVEADIAAMCEAWYSEG